MNADRFHCTVKAAGCQTFIIHARKAWLKGLSPRQNRTVPPLRYNVVYQLKRDFPELEIIINGGIKTLEEAETHLREVDGVMIGREAYDNPFLLAEEPDLARSQVALDYLPYIAGQLSQGVPFWKMSRHLLGIFQGQKGAKQWRRQLSGWRKGPEKLPDLREAMLALLTQINE